MSKIESPPQHQITTAGIGDAELIAAIHASCFDEVWHADAIREILAMPGAYCVLAHSEEDRAGLAIARTTADEAELLSLGVLPRHRRKGFGGALLHAICTMAFAGGGVRIFLEVAAENESALRLYRAFGFAECGFRRGYYAKRADTIDARTALVMHRELRPTAVNH